MLEPLGHQPQPFLSMCKKTLKLKTLKTHKTSYESGWVQVGDGSS